MTDSLYLAALAWHLATQHDATVPRAVVLDRERALRAAVVAEMARRAGA